MSAERVEFERHRNCAYCGQRLVHAQYDLDGQTIFTKRCPHWTADQTLHDFLEHRHAYPYRDRRGQVSDGTKARIR